MKTPRRHLRGGPLLPTLLLALALPLAAAAAEAPPGHGSLDCTACHQADAGSGMGVTGADRRCLSCHDATRPATVAAAAFHAGTEARCTDCHSFHHPDQLQAGGERFDHVFGDPAVTRHCAGCHGGANGATGVSEGHRAATALYHGRPQTLSALSPSEACLLCHGRNESDPRLLAEAAAAPRFQEHASHPYGAPVVPGRASGGFRIRGDVDPRLPLIDGRMECATCHDLTDDAPDRLVRFETPMQMCLGCHQRNGGAPNAVVATRTPDDPTGRPRGLSR